MTDPTVVVVSVPATPIVEVHCDIDATTPQGRTSMSDDTPEPEDSFKEKIKGIQFPRKSYVDQRTAEGSTQTHHTSGRVDANIVIPAPVQGTSKVALPGAETQDKADQ